MDKNPAVSIIVPLCNFGRYAKVCVDSILSQRFKDIEVILVDDASTDDSFALCQKFYGDNDKIKLFRHEEQRGLGAARNTGLKQAAGKYVCFVDGDDMILPDALDKFYTAAESSNAQVVHAATYYELAQDTPFPVRMQNVKVKKDSHAQEGFLTGDLVSRTKKYLNVDVTAPMAWLCFCRKDFLDDNKIEFLPAAEDEPFHFALLLFAERYYILDHAAYVRRKLSTAPNSDKFSKTVERTIEVAAYVKGLLERVEHFDGYDTWREDILDILITKSLQTHTQLYSALNRQVAFLSRQNNELFAQTLQLCNLPELVGNKVVLVSFQGRGFGCNPKYIALEILRQNLPYDLVCLVRDVNTSVPDGVRKVVYGSADSMYELATAKVIVTNNKSLLPFPGKKRGQFFIMTWHAWQALKWVEKDANLPPSYANYVEESKANSKITDLMMVGTQEMYEECRRAFWYDGEILKVGLPRNDLFFQRDEKLIAQVRRTLNIPTGNKIVMYAPTFRDELAVMADAYRFDVQKLLNAVRKRFGGDWTLIVRFHPNISQLFAKVSLGDNVINATAYPDMQELILIADVLISDYSSVICDFMFTDKPVFIYAKDFDTYPNERGFKPIFFELPYRVNRNEAELLADIETYDDAALEPKIRRFIEKVKPFDNGHAAEKVVERIKAFINASTIKPANVPTNFEAFEYVRNKYSAFLDSLPVYKSDGDTPKIFWWCWLQGLDNAPPISKMCLKALRRNYSDYQINVVTLENMFDFVSFPEHILRKFKEGKITPTHFSDLLRAELLIKYGGVWLDSCVLSTGSEKDYLREPLFIFQSTWRNEPAHLGSSWFIVSCKGNPILKTARDLLYQYWQDHDALGNGGFYFLFHCMFHLAASKYPDEWAKVPLFSNIPPHVLQMEFFKPYDPDRFEQIKGMSHFHKLTWKYHPAQLSHEQTKGSNYDYLMKFYA